MLLEILSEPRELLCNQNCVRINQNSADFSSVKAMETMFACMVGFSGSENSNMLIKISGDKNV